MVMKNKADSFRAAMPAGAKEGGAALDWVGLDERVVVGFEPVQGIHVVQSGRVVHRAPICHGANLYYS